MQVKHYAGFAAVAVTLSAAVIVITIATVRNNPPQKNDLQHAKTVLKQLSYNCADRLVVIYTSEQMTVRCK